MDEKIKSSEELALQFLEIAHQFKLGKLPTETPHAATVKLSYFAKSDLYNGINVIKDLDFETIKVLKNKLTEIEKLQHAVKESLAFGGRVFLCGCGATGRLSLALETLWKNSFKDEKFIAEKIVSFMAGGDLALIHSIEKFEDYPEYGEKQLLELGFKDGDLLIATTEGGETPFVIGATEAAARISKIKPYFLYCNPDEILITVAERSKKVIENPHIRKLNLTVGEMALTGSTRMQATTILMYAVGLSLFFVDEMLIEIQAEVDRVINFLNKHNFHFLKAFIEKESFIYKSNEHVVYETNEDLGITILTDTTERSPTFSLYAFENQLDEKKNPSLAYMYLSTSRDNAEAWEKLLFRRPRTLEWEDVRGVAGFERLMGFDISNQFVEKRNNYLDSKNYYFKIYYHQATSKISFDLDNYHYDLDVSGLSFLSIHIILKMIMNTHSTLVMGRLERYESNLMTWVRPSNNKLIDRAVRYATTLLLQKGISVEYDKLVKACFEYKDKIPRNESLVLKLVDEFSK